MSIKPDYFHLVNYKRLLEKYKATKHQYIIEGSAKPPKLWAEQHLCPMGTSFLFICSSYLYQLFINCFLLLCFLQTPRNTLPKTQRPSHCELIMYKRNQQLSEALPALHRLHRIQIKNKSRQDPESYHSNLNNME